MADGTARDRLVDRLVSSAKAFRDNPVYDSEGDGCYLVTQAEELEEAAAYIETLEAQHAENAKPIGELREAMRAMMLDQRSTGRRETYSDGFQMGLCQAIGMLDAALNGANK